MKRFLLLDIFLIVFVLCSGVFADQKEWKRQCVFSKDGAACYQLGLKKVQEDCLIGSKYFKLGCKYGHEQSCDQVKKYEQCTYYKALSHQNQRAVLGQDSSLTNDITDLSRLEKDFIQACDDHMNIVLGIYQEVKRLKVFPEVPDKVFAQLEREGLTLDDKKKLAQCIRKQIKLEQKRRSFSSQWWDDEKVPSVDRAYEKKKATIQKEREHLKRLKASFEEKRGERSYQENEIRRKKIQKMEQMILQTERLLEQKVKNEKQYIQQEKEKPFSLFGAERWDQEKRFLRNILEWLERN